MSLPWRDAGLWVDRQAAVRCLAWHSVGRSSLQSETWWKVSYVSLIGLTYLHIQLKSRVAAFVRDESFITYLGSFFLSVCLPWGKWNLYKGNLAAIVFVMYLPTCPLYSMQSN